MSNKSYVKNNIVYTWNSTQVAHWLKTIGFKQHQLRFLDECIYGEDLFDLTLEHLKVLNVDPVCAQQIITEIAKLRYAY